VIEFEFSMSRTFFVIGSRRVSSPADRRKEIV
jgi:hypothetical protein